MKGKMKTPNSDAAKKIIVETFGETPVRIERFATGNHHFVFDVDLPSGKSIVARLTLPSERSCFASALSLNRQFRAAGLPLPEIYEADLDGSYPYFIMERLPGTDLANVIHQLDTIQFKRLAGQLISMQKKVSALVPAHDRFGYAPTPEKALHVSWSKELETSLNRSKARITNAGVFSPDIVEGFREILKRNQSEVDSVSPVAFLHDITTKNVIINNGDLAGIVDIDDLCFGDPLFHIALTRMAVLSARGSLAYIDFLLENHGPYSKELFNLYTGICCVDFMGEIGQEFNGNPIDGSESKRLLFESTYHQLLAI